MGRVIMLRTGKENEICSYNDRVREQEEDRNGPLILQSTRKGRRLNPDAYRDMEGFDVDEELRRLRRALMEEATPPIAGFIQNAIENIDEHLIRGGRLPKAWQR